MVNKLKNYIAGPVVLTAKMVAEAVDYYCHFIADMERLKSDFAVEEIVARLTDDQCQQFVNDCTLHGDCHSDHNASEALCVKLGLLAA